MGIITALNIQEKLQKAGCVVVHYCTDLHTPVTKESKEIVDNFEFKQNVTEFKSQIDGVLFYEIPFCYNSEKNLTTKKSEQAIMKNKPKVIVQVSGGMISLVNIVDSIDVELRDYDIDTTTDEEFKQHDQEVFFDDNNDRYIIV